ncbi:MAG: carbohydrate porin, partial [Candidatus Omnitrophica bacterium]|nr:carbohydrate porin [Candidatus Omnitrophota bacterium]
KNSPVIESPDSTIGMRLGMPVKEFVELDMEILDGNGDFEQVGDHPYFGLQVNIKPRLMDKKGNYRFIYWLNETAHTKWSNAAKTKETGTGFGVSFDQEVADDIGVFLRAGWQRDEVYLAGEGFSLDSSYSAGFQLSGNLWNRQNDILGIAYGIINPSDEYKKAGPLHADAETHFEAYYNYQINSNVAISPDIQIITKPYGNDAVNGSSAIIAAGIRTQIDF